MIEGRTMSEVAAEETAVEITPEQALAYREAVKQLARLDARGMTVRRPDEWIEIPSRHHLVGHLASEVYLEGYREERRRKMRGEVA